MAAEPPSTLLFLSTPPSRVATDGDVFLVSPSSTFLSTPPSRVATEDFPAVAVVQHHFYPRHPRGWRREVPGRVLHPGRISIHATLAGGDLLIPKEDKATIKFLSTPPSRVATLLELGVLLVGDISIHATLAGGDPEFLGKVTR